MKALRDAQRFDPGDVSLDGLSGIPQIYGSLRIEPEVRRISEQPGEAKRHL
ncbi:MAG TPA: hypothetical protein VFZ24_15490 [Longimicrobiales bacterium]